MPSGALQRRVERVLADADVRIGGTRPWDLRVHDPHFYARVLAQGSLGLGEAYMDGGWDADSLDGLLFRLLSARIDRRVRGVRDLADGLRAWFVNLQRRTRSFEVGRRHYDLGNDLYRAMLGARMVYSCGYWREAQTLDAAQEAKLDLICRKLQLRPGLRLLDIGCGWGELLKFAAERYGVAGVGITVSQRQAEYARELCAGLPVEIRLQDYRDVHERFDRIASVGMFEHVGAKNYARYFDVARRCLADDGPDQGLFLLHTIASNVSVTHTDPWIDRYIFPNSMLPSAAQMARGCEGRFVTRGLARLRSRLRPHAAGVARQRRSGVAVAAGLRRALPAHVAFLPVSVDGAVPCASRAAVAAGPLAAWHPWRLRGGALTTPGDAPPRQPRARRATARRARGDQTRERTRRWLNPFPCRSPCRWPDRS